MEPLELEFRVRCSPEHAFTTWTAETSRWWPRDHTMSGDDDLTVTIEPRPGGRIFERATDGTEHDWGEVVVWEPPARLVYLWHLSFDRADATEVEITFAPDADGSIVRIEHRGWEHLGAVAEERRARNQHGWDTLIPHFEAACRVTGSPGRR